MALNGSPHETELLMEEIRWYGLRLGMDTEGWRVRRKGPPKGNPRALTLWFLVTGNGDPLGHDYGPQRWLANGQDRTRVNGSLCSIRDTLRAVVHAQACREGGKHGETRPTY